MSQATQLPMFADELQPGEYPVPEGDWTHCASCGAAIIWTRTPAGRAIPLALGTAREVTGQRVAMTHFVDCPHKDEWRRT